MTRLRAFAATTVAATFALACEIVAPNATELPIRPAVVVSIDESFADVLKDANEVTVRITIPGLTPRDTLLSPQREGDRIRIRLVLHPDEGTAGTEIELTVIRRRPVWLALPLFSGTTVLDPARGRPLEARIRLDAVATLEAGGNVLTAPGRLLPLADRNVVRFLDGRIIPTHEVAWTSEDPTVMRIQGDTATALRPGQTRLFAAWTDQVDTIDVEVEPVAILLSPDSLRFYVGPGDVVSDSVRVGTTRVGGTVSPLTATADAAFPWLSANLRGYLVVTVVDSLLPPGGEVGRVVVSSAVPGVADAVLRVDARSEPATGVESRVWSPLCFFGDSLSSPRSGVTACVDIRARAWNEGGQRRVVVEARNLSGSLGGSLDTAVLDLEMFGIATGASGQSTLLAWRTNGPTSFVGTGTPFLDRDATYPGQFRAKGSPRTTIAGCTGATRWENALVTCDPQGLTGAIRTDYQIADTTWSLGAAVAVIGIYVRGAYNGQCGSSSPVCLVP